MVATKPAVVYVMVVTLLSGSVIDVNSPDEL